MFRLLNKCDSSKSKITKQISLLKCCSVYSRKKSYYHVLGVDSTASAKDIKSAYYKLSLQFHPDKNDGSPESVTKFREITEAYEILGNPEKKKIYDERGNFQSQYSFDRTRSYYRPKSYSSGPYTGKTRDFNFDEHFRKHYEEYQKQRESEHEYFKRKWEAEYYRRYPYRKRDAENKEAFEEVSRRFVRRRQSYFFLFSFWTFIILVQMYKDVINPDVPKYRAPVYYDVETKKNEVQND